MSVGIALAGLGDIGLRAHLPALLRSPAVRVAALVDPDAERRELARDLADAPCHATLDPVLDDPAVDAVVLATPPWVTTGLIGHIAATGRYVLAEKPLATSPEAAKELADLPGAQRARVQAGLTYRHDPALEQLREWIAAGRLGDRLLVRAHIYDERRDAGDPVHTERIEVTLGHGIPVVHEGAHVFDWFAFLFGGPPDQVADAWALTTRPGLPAPNLCGARLDYPHGIVVLAEFGWLTEALPRCEISLLGDRGHAVLGGHDFALELSTVDGVERVVFEPDRATRCFDRQLARFVELVTGERAAPSPDLDDGLAALRVAARVAELAVAGER
jgi:myo-inositol 2-dehydrogenase/D-chiro-inositol 1-dehydrogenase